MEFDRPTRTIAEFAASLSSEDISESAVAAVVRHHFDSIGCAIGALDAGPSRIAREIARSTTIESGGCSVFGLVNRVAPEQAVFANVSMVRQLDFNDFFAGGERSGHLSDMIPAVVAAAEFVGATGLDVVRGIYLAYEVFSSLGAIYPIKEAGWDVSGVFSAIGTAVGAGCVFNLTSIEMANAISISLTPSMSLLCTRTGEVSNWKGSASAHGAMTGLFAARVTHAGMTGPKMPFEGAGGLNEQVAPERGLEIGGSPSTVERSSFKQYPAVGATQGIIGPLLSARGGFDLRDVEIISIHTNENAWTITGGGAGDIAEKWNPTTRETADHSMPYIVAVGLIDGDITPTSYSPQRIADPVVLSLMRRITVEPRKDLTALFPAERKTEIRIRLTTGNEILVLSGHPLGSPQNPMSDDQLTAKFQSMSHQSLSQETTSDLESVLWNLADLKDLNELTRHYRAMVPSDSER